jgi:hypothetical protein
LIDFPNSFVGIAASAGGANAFTADGAEGSGAEPGVEPSAAQVVPLIAPDAMTSNPVSIPLENQD